MTESPKSPEDPRPNGEPYYLDYTDCPDCGNPLSYYHELTDENLRESEMLVSPEFQPEGWRENPMWDEFVCKKCLNGVHLDWPDSEWEKVEKAKQSPSESFEPLGGDNEED